MRSKDLICVTCGKRFFGGSTAKYCTPKCRNKPYCKITWSVLSHKGIVDRKPMWVCSKHWIDAQIVVNARRLENE